MPKNFRVVSTAALLPLAIAALTVCSGASAAAKLETFGLASLTGVSNGGTTAVTYDYDNVYFYDNFRNAQSISPNTPLAGYSGIPSISADGLYIASSINGSDGTAQAGVYNTYTFGWTQLGGLGNGAYYQSNDINQSSYASGISANGSTVFGAAAYSTTANAATGVNHAVVWRGGQIYDLNGGTNTNGRIVASNADGTMVSGYTNNNDRNTQAVWTWNGSGYTKSATPTIASSFYGDNVRVNVTGISANGVWGAGDSSINTVTGSYGSFGRAVVFQQATLWNSQTNATIYIPFDHVLDTSANSADIDRNMRASIAGVLNDGTVFGTYDSCADSICGGFRPTFDAWVYSATTGQSITFDSYLAAQGITLTASQHVNHIDGVSADGSAITGTYFDTDSFTTTAFMVSNISAVPEPGQWALLALGLPLLAARRLRNRRAD